MCSCDNGGKKVISKKRNLGTPIGTFGHFKSEFRKNR